MHAIKKKFTKNQLTFLQIKNLKEKKPVEKAEAEKRRQKVGKPKDARGKKKIKRRLDCGKSIQNKFKSRLHQSKNFKIFGNYKKLKKCSDNFKNKDKEALERQQSALQAKKEEPPRKEVPSKSQKRSKSLYMYRKEDLDMARLKGLPQQRQKGSELAKTTERKKSLTKIYFKDEKINDLKVKKRSLNLKNLIEKKRKKSNSNLKNLKNSQSKFYSNKMEYHKEQQEKQKKKKQSFLEIVTKNQNTKGHFTFSQNDKLKTNNISTSSNNKNLAQIQENDEGNLLNQIQIKDIKNAFELFLKEHVKANLHFEYVRNEISEYFSDNNPESWDLGFETLSIFYNIEKKIGTYVGRNRFLVSQVLTGQPFWIESISKSRNLGRRVRREVAILTALKDTPFVVPFYEMFEDKKNFYLVFEKSSDINLDDFLEGEPSTLDTEQLARVICLNLLKSVEYIHSCGIVKRNMAPSTIYVDNENNLKLFDFSGSSIIHQKNPASQKPQDPSFLAPELTRDSSISDPKSDVYSCGRIMKTIYDKFDLRSERMEDLIEQMVNADRKQRPRVEDCLNHAFFRCHREQVQSSLDSVLDDKSLVENSKHYKIAGSTPGQDNKSEENHLIDFENKMGPNECEGFKLADNKKQNQFKLINNKLAQSASKSDPATGLEIGACDRTRMLTLELVQSLILEYLSICGFEIDYLKRMLFSGESESFCHAGACYKILIKKFYLK